MSKKQVNIIWFRNDLRTQDHPVLEAALKSDLPVIGLYCFEPRLYQDYFYGLKKLNHLERNLSLKLLKI